MQYLEWNRPADKKFYLPRRKVLLPLVRDLQDLGDGNRNGGTSTSDTSAAVIMRDGWTLAEARAKDSELIFKRSEQAFLRLILRICRDMAGINLRLGQVDMKFTRRNYEAIQSKAQVLDLMLKQPKLHPQLAFVHCGMFSDPESAYAMSMKYAAEHAAPEQPPGEDAENTQGDARRTAGFQ